MSICCAEPQVLKLSQPTRATNALDPCSKFTIPIAAASLARSPHLRGHLPKTMANADITSAHVAKLEPTT